jgi:hypothetical protein
MTAIEAEDSQSRREAPPSTSLSLPLVIAAAVALLHLLTNGRYGFHRDEFQFLSDARHLDWGFVAYPPFTPFVERIGLTSSAFRSKAPPLLRAGAGHRHCCHRPDGARAWRQAAGAGTAALAVALSPLPHV